MRDKINFTFRKFCQELVYKKYRNEIKKIVDINKMHYLLLLFYGLEIEKIVILFLGSNLETSSYQLVALFLLSFIFIKHSLILLVSCQSSDLLHSLGAEAQLPAATCIICTNRSKLSMHNVHLRERSGQPRFQVTIYLSEVILPERGVCENIMLDSLLLLVLNVVHYVWTTRCCSRH